MEQCPVCGRTYGVTHSCSGPASAQTALATKWPVPIGFAPVQYFRQALAIAQLDDGAILAASLDKNAMFYGVAIWLAGQFLVSTLALRGIATPPGAPRGLVIAVSAVFLILVNALSVLLQLGLCHLLARVFFGARGTFLGVFRPLLLGSLVIWLIVVPYIGTLAAGLWSIAVMMVVFEDVDGIERLQAFGLSAVIGGAFWVLAGLLIARR